MTTATRPRKLAPAFQWASDVARLRNGAHEKSVALALVAHTTDLRIDLPVYPSNDTICEFTGLDDSAVRKGLRALEAAGLVRREVRPRQPSLIWLTRVGSTPHQDRQPGSAQPPMNNGDGGSVQPSSRGVRSTRVESSSMGGSFNPGSRCDSTRVGSTPQSPDSDHENQNQNPLILSDLKIVAREPRQAAETRGSESISSTGESESQTPAPPEAEMPTTRREPSPDAPASQPTPIATATPSATAPTRPAQPAPSVAVALPPDDDPDLGPMISTVGAPLAERAVSLWGPTLAAELGARIHAVRADRQTHTRARSLVMRALDARLESPPTELERVLPPLGAPEFVAGEDAQKATLCNLSRTLAGAPSRPAVTAPRVETAPPAANGAQKPPPLDRRPVLERFAEQPESVKARWLDDVDRVSGGALVGVAREAAAANRWDKAQSRPTPTVAGRLNGAAGRA